MSENDVNITRNKRLLEEIRERETNGSEQSGSGVGGRYNETRNDRIKRAPGSDETVQRATQGSNGTGREARAAPSGHGEGVRPPFRENVRSTKGTPAGDGRTKGNVNFILKPPFGKKKDKEPTRLFSLREAEEALERMTEIYFRGSSLIDDLIEITVKDHEPVQIWQMESEEAETFAEMHLRRAQVDPRAAASARQLLGLYDRLYFWLYVAPRSKATYTHARAHGGFSFR